MLGARSWNIWIYVADPITSLNIGVNVYWAVNTILSTRVYLNLVWIYRKPTLSTSMNPGINTSAGNVRGTTGINIIAPTRISTYVSSKDEGEDGVWGYRLQSSKSPVEAYRMQPSIGSTQVFSERSS
jgi:hypothetical protein